MIEGLKVLDKWCPISRSPIVNVSRVLFLLGPSIIAASLLGGWVVTGKVSLKVTGRVNLKVTISG